MNRLTAKGGAKATYHNQHAYKQQINTCWCLILTALAVFCLFCIYTIDYKGKHQDVVHIVTDISHSFQNYTIASLYNSTQQFGKEFEQDLGQTATVVHFHQYNFTQAMMEVWNSLVKTVNKLLQKVRSAIRGSVVSEDTSSKEQLRIEVTSSQQSHSMAVKQQKSCEVQGKDGQCPKKIEYVSQSETKQAASKTQETQVEDSPQVEENKGQERKEPVNGQPEMIV